MPKAEVANKENAGNETRVVIQGTQSDIKQKTSYLIVGGRGEAVKELVIGFSTADRRFPSTRGDVIAALIKRTPNLTSLTLKFSGPLHSYDNCLGDKLVDALCKLKHIQTFRHEAMTCARTDFGLLTLLRLVSSWPDLQHLYTAGDTYGYPDEKTVASIPPPTCKIVSATFERFMSRFAQSSVLLAGSSESFKDLEMYALSHGAFLGFVKPVLGSIRSIKLGGNTGMTPDCIAALATQAPKLETLSLCGECDDDALKALADALNVEGSFPALRTIEYPAPREMHKTGRRRNVREHGHEDAYEDELRAAAGKRSISCWVGHALEYKVEGAQRRAGMAAMGRKYGGW